MSHIDNDIITAFEAALDKANMSVKGACRNLLFITTGTYYSVTSNGFNTFALRYLVMRATETIEMLVRNKVLPLDISDQNTRNYESSVIIVRWM